ncbi:MAG: ATP-binding protein, partial [candidate division WOR-3 bacterium]
GIGALLHGRIGAVYHGVFAWQLGVLGTFCILRASSRPLEHTAVLEAFVRQAAIALERKHQAEELEKHRRQLAELVDQRTADLRQAQAELVRRERLAVLGQVAGSVAHELRNPLGVIRNVVSFLGMALGGHGHHQVRRNLELINRQIDRADRVLAALLDVTHGRAPQRTRVSASALITEAVGELARPEQVVVERIEPEGEQFILADSDQVRLAVGNVIRNAYEAMPSGGRLRIEVRPEGEMVALIFQDTGEGIGADVLPRIFEPLFTTKTVGAGLGLSICRAFVENNHGAVEVQSQPGEGTVVIVRLPAAP